MSRYPEIETWQLRKPVVESAGGVVSSQHYRASRVGAEVLRTGGNAVDAAVATSFAISAVEPWMSGLGGGGYMLIYSRKERTAKVVSFGMRAPGGISTADYPVIEGHDSDLFGWPRVVDDRNVHGPLSIAVPGQVAGMAMALEHFGTRSWSQCIAPALEFAKAGIAVDWYATLKIAGNAADLARYAESRRIFLPNNLPPAADWASALPKIWLGNLAATLERLASQGPDDFYQGQIAQSLVADIEQLGGKLGLEDLRSYRAHVCEVAPVQYRQAELFAAPELTAGPTLIHALELLAASRPTGGAPDSAAYVRIADALVKAYEKRLNSLGDVDERRAPSSTTHFSVADSDGNLVACTQTLLSVFGSRVVLPGSGLLMNNGMMWFDPRPGRPNSIAPGKRPLSNMCPTVVCGEDGRVFALGASGGRRIMPAVFQLVSFLIDHGLSLERAMHTPRIDYSGAGLVTANNALPSETVAALAAKHQTDAVYDSVYPSYFACPNVAAYDTDTQMPAGAAFVTSPWAEAAPA